MAVTTTRRRKMQNKMRKKSLIKTYGTFLEGLTHLSNKCRKKMIQESPKEVIDCVGECCINLIKGNVRLTNAQKNQLRARKQHIRILSSKQVPLDTKKKIINQKGGALLGLLLKPLIAPIIGSVLGEIIKKLKNMDGRKMAIVPFKLWEDMKRWKEEQIQNPRLPPDPNVSATASLQRDLSSVMANEDLSEAEKSQLYGQTLHKFKTAHQKVLKETSLFPQSDPSSSRMNQLVIDSVPSTMKRKAQLLVSLLKTNPNVSWEDDGTVKLYGKSIPGSNIIDLVNDVIRHRKGSEPTGWQSFAEGLRDMNIPQDVIGNRERWDWMHRAPETPETDYITPKQKRTIRKTASRIPVSVRSAKSLSVRKRIKDHFSSPALLSATKKRIKEEFSSPWVSYNEA